MSDLIRNLRGGLKANIKANIPDVQVSQYALGNPTPPGIHILPPGVGYHKAMRGGKTDYAFTVQAFVALSSDIGPQILLDELLEEDGERSLCAAIESDKTLGGYAQDLIVVESAEARWIVTASNQALLLADWAVTVLV